MQQPAETGATMPHVQRYDRVAVVGAGAWGTALAATARQSGSAAVIWGRSAEVMVQIADARRNSRFLPDVLLPAGLEATTDLTGALTGADAVLLAVPSGAVRDVARAVAAHLTPGVPVAVCAKGIEAETGLMMTQVAASELPAASVGALSGPTFAREAALGHPTAATAAFVFDAAGRRAPHLAPAFRLAATLTTEAFRVQVSDDVTGVEIGGAVKNVIAIACGMMFGAGYAENTRAALITAGLSEMRALAEALGGRRETLTGLSGIGDLCLTCASPTSRNMALGLQLGQGRTRAECFDGRAVVVEGERNAATVLDLASRAGVQMPICEAVHAIVHRGADLRAIFAAYWARPMVDDRQAVDLAFALPYGD